MFSWEVIGIGALNWDLIYTLPDLTLLADINIPIKHGQEIHLEPSMLAPLLDLLNRFGEKKAESGGGQAANTIYALARMGFKTRLIGKVGQDVWGDLILKSLGGVDISHVIREDGSGICISLLTPDGERSMVVFPNVNNNLDMNDLNLSVFKDCHFLHLTSFASRYPLRAQIELMERLQKGPLISFDPGNLYAGMGLNAILPILRKTYCLFATDHELERITDLQHEHAALRLLNLGVQIVVCKQGSKGAYLLDHHKRLFFPAMETEVKDVTGAGDCFAAGFLAGLIMGENLETCGRIGTYAAMSCISGYGRETYPDAKMLNRMIKSEITNNS